MDEGRGSASPEIPSPHGFAVSHSPAGSPGLWHEITVLPDGRLGMAIGRCPGSPQVDGLADAIGAALRAGADPVAALAALDSPGSSALCGVIDPRASTLAYSALGDVTAVLAAPDTGHRVLAEALGTLATATLAPGGTLLLCTGTPALAGSLLDECASAHPRTALDGVVSAVDSAVVSAVGVPRQSFAALLYRHPPAPLDMTLLADPSSLAVVRDRLRCWLTLVGVDAEDSADALLAIGEAASNSAEHSVGGMVGEVVFRIHAAVVGEQLRFTVSDNGRWKSVRDRTGHRGHGIKLINALVDAADVTTGEHGTTVTMLKEMRP